MDVCVRYALKPLETSLAALPGTPHAKPPPPTLRQRHIANLHAASNPWGFVLRLLFNYTFSKFRAFHKQGGIPIRLRDASIWPSPGHPLRETRVPYAYGVLLSPCCCCLLLLLHSPFCRCPPPAAGLALAVAGAALVRNVENQNGIFIIAIVQLPSATLLLLALGGGGLLG